MLVAALAGCRPWAAAAASRPAAAAAACRSAVAVRVRAMAGQADGDPAAAAGAATVEATVAVAAAQEQQQQQAARLRNYPDEPRVGVGIVILRQLQQARPEVLLIRRAKEPSKGAGRLPLVHLGGAALSARRLGVVCNSESERARPGERRAMLPERGALPASLRRPPSPPAGLWCFPGGSLELGESLVECAVRETEEETGVQLRNAPQEGAPPPPRCWCGCAAAPVPRSRGGARCGAPSHLTSTPLSSSPCARVAAQARFSATPWTGPPPSPPRTP